MLPVATIAEVRRLLREGELSQRQIAAELKVSRGTVGAIARGTRQDRRPRSAVRVTDVFSPEEPPERCRGCGALVQMPCVLCRTRRYLAGGGVRKDSPRRVA